MDKSETYIKMCDCEEIQSIVKPAHTVSSAWKTGDYVANAKLLKVTIVSGIQRPSRKLVWLPRQDQLQGMLDNRFSNRYNCVLADKFGRYCTELTSASGKFALSMEQLWLSFIMKEKYNKLWTGKEWKQ